MRSRPSVFVRSYRRLLRAAAVFNIAVFGAVFFAAASSSGAATAQAAAAASLPSASAPIDLEAERQLMTPVGKDWRFHAGDDARWAEPGFDDSAWKVVQPKGHWTEKGCVPEGGLMWFRFHMKIPAKVPALVLLLPKISAAYQVFADGRMVGQAGGLPPGRPSSPIEASRVFTLPTDRARPSAMSGGSAVAGKDTKEMVVAIRVWEDPKLARVDPGAMFGNAFVGGPKPLITIFQLSNAWDLLAHGNDFTQCLLALIVGASSLLLFGLTRQSFYGWFAANMLVGVLGLPFTLAAQHFGIDYGMWTYAGAALDFLGAATYVLFVLGALNVRSRGLLAGLVAMNLVAELGPLLYMLAGIPLALSDGTYLLFTALPGLILAGLLVRGWRLGSVFAKFLLVPYLLSLLLGMSGNLGHFLIDVGVPKASALLTSDIEVLQVPFLVTLNDLGNVLSTLGMLGVLVYQFARSSREEQRLTSALQTAHDIQHSLVPVDIPRLGGLHTEIVYLAAEEVGGDFCQVLPRADGSILIVIGDVSGKGLQAAMLGTLAVGALRSMADEEIGPAAALARLNNVLLRTTNKGFITCLCLNLTPGGTVIMANAGHLSPYLDGVELPTAAGLPLGLVQDMAYEQTTFVLAETARLTLMSDGVVEARAEDGELFGFDRTSKVSQLTANEIAAQANRFGQEDDITVITLDWRLPAMVAVS